MRKKTMSDVEIEPTGHTREIFLSRVLANAIANQIEKDASILSDEIRKAYNLLYGEYIRQQQAGEM